MPLIVKLIGALRYALGKRQLSIDCQDGVSIRNLLTQISEDSAELKQSLTNQQSEPQPTTLILVNGKEISVLNGLDTKLHDGDEIVLIPIVHGG